MDTHYLTPAQAFEAFKAEALSGSPDLTPGLWADDVVVEMPFAPNGGARIVGRAAFAQVASAGRAALPGALTGFVDVVIHVDRDDPDTAIIEYTITGRLGDGQEAALPFLVILTVGKGQIRRWREYRPVMPSMPA